MLLLTTMRRALWLISITALLAGCKREALLADLPPIEVVISQPITNEKIADWDVYTGYVEPKESVEIRSRVRGHIKEILFKDGDEVDAGSELFVIDSSPFQADLKQAKGQLTSWEAKLKAAEEKVAIFKPLAEKGTVSKDELIQALAAKGEALGGIMTTGGKIMEADLNIGFCKVNAPIAGKLSRAYLTKGNLVNATGSDSLLTTMVSVDPMYVYFNVNERKILYYKEILREQAAKAKAPINEGKSDPPAFPVELALASGTGLSYKYKGVLDFVDNRIDPATGSLKVRARFDNPKGPDGRRSLLPGLFARVRISLVEPAAAIQVADRAILSDQSMKYVLAVNQSKNNLVERIDVVPADRVQDSGLRAIEAGLKGDEWIIVEGVNRARPGVTVNPKEGAMPRRPKVSGQE